MPASVVSEDPLTSRSRYAVPGYSGYIPGKVPEVANMGQRFALCNQHGVKSLKGDAPQPAFSWKCGGPRGHIPGYSGHVPGKLEDRKETCSSQSAQAHQALPSPARNYQGTVTPRPGSGKAVAAVVGYSGHVPGKHAENVVGHSFAAANARAAVEESGPGCHTWKRSEAPGVAPHRLGAGAAPGKAVPGYAGYVHGVRPEPDIMGMPFKAANEHADKARLSTRAKDASPKASGRASDRVISSGASVTSSKQSSVSKSRSNGGPGKTRS
ncbi:unnamed protein product [Durusdinium trenchii]|uniref:Flagellar associated protein n=1 Tax=Durusdinium trenchii TaxID=1381693 RepID=A0ABP0I0I7_9DINO